MPAGGGYEPPPGGLPAGPGGQPYSIGDAFSFAFAKFQQNLATILLGALIYIGAVAVFSFLWFLIVGVLLGSGTGTGFVASLIAGAAFSLVIFVGQFLIQAGITRAALGFTDGKKVELSTVLDTDQLGPVILGSLLISVAAALGFLLCYLPGLVVVFFTQFFVHFAIDKKLDPIDAIKASFEFVNANLGPLLLFYLASLAAYFLGALLCGIGLFVALPVVFIAQAYTYRRLQGEPVAA